MDDKRRFRRFTVEGIHGNVNFVDDVEIVNISAGGAALISHRQLVINREYTLKIKNGGKIIMLKGIVVWSVLSESRKGPHGDIVPLFRIGIQFKDVVSEKMEELMNFIENHKEVEDQRLSGIRFKIRAPEKTVLNYSFSYKVKKISIGGMLIETEHSLEPENKFPMSLYLPGDRTVSFSGRIAYCHPTPKEATMLYDVGIEFLEMSEDGRTTIKRFIKSLGAK